MTTNPPYASKTSAGAETSNKRETGIRSVKFKSIGGNPGGKVFAYRPEADNDPS